MRRTLSCFVALVLIGACSGTEPDSTVDSASSSGETTDAPDSAETVDLAALTGQIVFERRPESQTEALIYTMNPDGSQVEQLFPKLAWDPRWSPDGTEIALLPRDDDGMAAHIVDVETGELRTLPQPDPTLETYCDGPWSPDGTRLTCQGFDVDDPSRNGIYTINSSDGGDLRRITSTPAPFFDVPGDYSPDGNQLVFMRFGPDYDPIGIFVTNVDGTGVTQLTPPDMIIDGWFTGRWSPTGDKILFVARTTEDEHQAIWIVSADGGDPQQLPIPTCGGPFESGNVGCSAPSWSPDGEQIVFVRSDETSESIYVVNADGSGLVQLTVTDGRDTEPDWGPSVP